jgi:hypothetical protein
MLNVEFCRRSKTILCLSLGILLLLSAHCGDFTLFDDGDGGNGDNGSTEEVCPLPFSNLDDYTDLGQLSPDEPLDNPVALAVVPPGMEFTFNSRAVEPGDVLVADRDKGKIFVVPSGGTAFEMITVQAPAGLALFSWIPEDTALEEEIHLLFYTSATRDSFFIYDLAGTLFPTSLPSIEVTNTLLSGAPLQEPTSLAVLGTQEKASLFVLNSQTIVRINVNLGASPSFETDTLARNFSNLRDMAYRSSTDQLFFTQNNLDELDDVIRIFRISNATEATPIPLDGLAGPLPFLEENPGVLTNPAGLAIPFTDQEGGQSALLVTQPLVQLYSFIQYDPTSGSYEASLESPNPDQPAAIAYDCTNQRILFTNIPLNQELFGSLWEIKK